MERSSVVEVRREGAVARVILDRPPLNVIDLEGAGRLAEALEDLAGLIGLRAVVLEGRGRAFCAGVDVRDHLPDRGAAMLREFHRACLALGAIPVPTVAVVHGPALGGGCELTLMCDLVLAAETASFGQPEIKLGVVPPVAAVALPRLVPPRVATEMLLLGRILGGREAERVGLVNRAVPEPELADAVAGFLQALGGLSLASLRLTKEALALSRHRPSAAEIESAERFYVERVMDTPDAIEGLRAFLEKRTPAWTGIG